MYLYIFEDGAICWNQEGPTKDDVELIHSGILMVLCNQHGTFVEVQTDDRGKIKYDEVPQAVRYKKGGETVTVPPDDDFWLGEGWVKA